MNGTTAKNRNKIIKIQKKAIRIMTNSSYNAHTNPLYIEHGVSVPFSHQLPGITVQNSMSVAAHGEQFTDVLAHWLKKGFVSGPFILPPYEINTVVISYRSVTKNPY